MLVASVEELEKALARTRAAQTPLPSASPRSISAADAGQLPAASLAAPVIRRVWLRAFFVTLVINGALVAIAGAVIARGL